MNRVRKIAEITETNDAEQSIVGWGSKPIPDRDGELIESSAWKLEQYRKNPVLMLSHDYSSPPVGKCLWVKADSNGLKFKAKFANTERGREIYELYKGGYMSGFSVGFSVNTGGSVDHPTEPKYKGIKRVYKDVDLLEISCVAIPACPDALVEQVKSGKIKCKQLKDEMDQIIELVEKAHTGEIEEQHVESSETKEEGTEEEKGITSEEVEVPEEQKATPKCPAGGEYGVDFGEYDECGECSFAENCKGMSKGEEEGEGEKAAVRKPKEEPAKEGDESKKPCIKEGPSIYDLVRELGKTLPVEGYVVDVTPHSYPDGEFTYCKDGKFYSSPYTYSLETKTCSLGDTEEEKDPQYILDKYEIDNEKKVVEKEGRVLSGSNRKLISDCVAAMKSGMGVLENLLSATEKKEDPPVTKNEEDEDELEITKKEYDLSSLLEKSAEKTEEEDEEGTLEIDPEDLKKVLKDTYAEMVKGGMEEAVTKALKKVRGNVI